MNHGERVLGTGKCKDHHYHQAGKISQGDRERINKLIPLTHVKEVLLFTPLINIHSSWYWTSLCVWNHLSSLMSVTHMSMYVGDSMNRPTNSCFMLWIHCHHMDNKHPSNILLYNIHFLPFRTWLEKQEAVRAAWHVINNCTSP